MDKIQAVIGAKPMLGDLIIENARLLTMDQTAPRAEAIAISGERIAAVGDLATVRASVSPRARVIDAAGGTVMPGFIESHMHLFAGAAQLDNLSLAGLDGFDAVAEAIRNRAASKPNERLLMAEQAVYGQFGHGTPITRHILDRILQDRPLALYAGDHHTMWANTAALRAAGVLNGLHVRPGNEVVIGEDGLASGELREFDAFAPVIALTPTGGREALGLQGKEPSKALTAEERATDRGVLKRGLDILSAKGITSFHNMDGNRYQLELLQEIDDAHGLSCRARVPFRILPGFDLARLDNAVDARRQWNSDRLKADFVKIFMDGVIEAANAWMLDDFGGMPGSRGLVYFEQDEFDAICVAVDKLGFQIAVHAIGDRAVRRTLDGYAAATKVNGRRDSRHRVEHIETLAPADLPRFAAEGVLCSMQPTHAAGCYFPAEPSATLIGRERLKTAYAWQTLRNSGATIVFSSDWPVAPLEPLINVKAAMLRQRIYPDEPDQRQTLYDALSAYTSGGAYAEFAEGRRGILKAGRDADVVVLSRNLEGTPAEEIDQVRPVVTICGGRITHAA